MPDTTATRQKPSEPTLSPPHRMPLKKGLALATSAFFVANLVYLATAWLSHRHWFAQPTESHGTVITPTQLVQGRLIRHDKDTNTYLPDADGRLALAVQTAVFDAQQRPLIEVHVGPFSGNRQYRLAWLSSADEDPHFFILNQPVAGVSLTDLSLAEGWQGRIRQLGLISEPLFPMGWSHAQNTAARVGDVQWPQPDLWQALRHQWHAWLSWMPPRYGDINHLPFTPQLPWYASPVVVLVLVAALLGGLMAYRKRKAWPVIVAMAIGSLFVALINAPQGFGLQKWASQSVTGVNEKPVVLNSDRPLKPVIDAIRQSLDEIPESARQIIILGNDYHALRLYWYLLPQNVMWFPGWSERIAAAIQTNRVFVVPFEDKTGFNLLIEAAKATKRPYQVTPIANQWWLVSLGTAGELPQ